MGSLDETDNIVRLGPPDLQKPVANQGVSAIGYCNAQAPDFAYRRWALRKRSFVQFDYLMQGVFYVTPLGSDIYCGHGSFDPFHSC
jgi:hypothetical protein